MTKYGINFLLITLSLEVWARTTDFSLKVSILSDGGPVKWAQIALNDGKCSTSNGGETKSRPSTLCQEFQRRFSAQLAAPPQSDSHTSEKNFVLTFKSGSTSWAKMISAYPRLTCQPNGECREERQAGQDLAHFVLDAALE